MSYDYSTPNGNVPKSPCWCELRSPVSSSDEDLDGLDNADFSTSNAGYVYPYTGILLRAFGTDADNETATVSLSGWNPVYKQKPGETTTYGPGTILWEGQVTLGSNNLAAGTAPYPTWTKGSSWFEVDTWDDTAGSGFDIVGAEQFSGGSQNLLALPTLGFSWIMAKVQGVGDGGSAASLGLLWYGVTTEGGFGA